jgi:hypothetical protein
MLMPVAVATTYFFNLFLVPKYLEKRRYFWFALYTFYTIVFSIFLSAALGMLSFIVLTDLNWTRMSPIAGDIFQLGMIIYLIAIVFSFIRLYQLKISKEEEIAELEKINEKNILRTLVVRSNRESISILVEDILYVESLSDYVKIHSISGIVITKEKISKLEDVLPEWFIRIHRSFLVNKKKVEAFGHDYVKVHDQQLPVGRKYKNGALSKIDSESIKISS